MTSASVLAVLLATFLALREVRRQARAGVQASLATVLAATDRGVQAWAANQRGAVEFWTTNTELRHLAVGLATAPPGASSGSPARAALDELVLPVLAVMGHPDYGLLAPDGGLLAGSLPGHPARTVPEPFLKRVLTRGVALSPPQRAGAPGPSVAVMFAAAPVRNDEGRAVAVLVFRIDAGVDFADILRQARVGATGEAYAFDGEGRLVSESRFENQLRLSGLLSADEPSSLALILKDPGVNLAEGGVSGMERADMPFVLSVREGMAGRAGSNVDGYRDYRGVPVVGAWRWDEDIEMGIAAEIDVAQAYGPYLQVRQILLWMSGLFVLLVLLLSWDAGKRARLEQDLRQALAKVLSGYLPICANCKRIRDGEGAWTQVEEYVSQSTEAHFSHTICPSCMTSLYGEDLAKAIRRKP